MVAEAEPQAAAIGCQADVSTVDNAKFPKYVVGQQCDNCALYQGKFDPPASGCSLVAGKS
ncbi:high-potential iron-sulfur protein [Polynucleobacter sp. AM-7D1]|nr:high-potential iron-sulfur protein [Polynucleobacter sp. AM-7D1]